MPDLFGRNPYTIQSPLTADNATLTWGTDVVTAAVNFNASYAQQVQRRHTIGNRDTVIFASQPMGTITIQRLLTTDASQLFNEQGWQVCNGPGTIYIDLAGCNAQGGFGLVATGCLVTQYQLSGEAEGLSIIDNIVIEFLQLSQTTGSTAA